MCPGVGVGLLGGHAIEVYTHAYFPNGELLEGVTVPYTPRSAALVPHRHIPTLLSPTVSPPSPPHSCTNRCKACPHALQCGATYVSSNTGLLILKVVSQLFDVGKTVVAKLVVAICKPDQLEVNDRALRPSGADNRTDMNST